MRLPTLLTAVGLPLIGAGCGHPDSLDYGSELESDGFAVTCSPHLDYYPIAGPHNGGYDSNALNYTCPSHPGGSPDNSDWIGGDHYGNDLFGARGTPVRAVVSGTISHSGYASISGNRVTIRDNCGWHYFSAHLDSITPGMSVGRSVSAGEIIGLLGNTGNASGTSPHVHFSIYPESYEAGVDPFPLLQGVDAGACTGEAALSAGQTPNPPVNPCTNANIQSDDNDSSFAVVQGAQNATSAIGGPNNDQSFTLLSAFSAPQDVAVGRWGPWISHTGKWEVEVFIPQTSVALSTQATYDVTFQGGRALAVVNQQANKGSWVPLFPGQPFKFLAGPRGYTALSNVLGAGQQVALDKVRWVYIGPEGGGTIGEGCSLSTDCVDRLICGEGGTCQQDCVISGCDAGTCDSNAGICVEPDTGAGDLLEDLDQDTDGDGIPDYMEGWDDTDGDLIPDYADRDTDEDGIPDSVEGSRDTDGDGLMDSGDSDSDGDGILDADEVGANPDQPTDTDEDGLADHQDPDADGDGIPDSVESDDGAPRDTDRDGRPDHLDTDSDNDGIDDGDEAGYVPEQPNDLNQDGVPDYLQAEHSGEIAADGLHLPEAPGPADEGCACDASGGASPGWFLLPLLLIPRRRR